MFEFSKLLRFAFILVIASHSLATAAQTRGTNPVTGAIVLDGQAILELLLNGKTADAAREIERLRLNTVKQEGELSLAYSEVLKLVGILKMSTGPVSEAEIAFVVRSRSLSRNRMIRKRLLCASRCLVRFTACRAERMRQRLSFDAAPAS